MQPRNAELAFPTPTRDETPLPKAELYSRIGKMLWASMTSMALIDGLFRVL
jgi:hypothetical protein